MSHEQLFYWRMPMHADGVQAVTPTSPFGLINARRIARKRIASHGIRSAAAAAAVMIEVAASAFAAECFRLA
jgi:hypothetical protein